jgi:hypothetical protein
MACSRSVRVTDLVTYSFEDAAAEDAAAESDRTDTGSVRGALFTVLLMGILSPDPLTPP